MFKGIMRSSVIKGRIKFPRPFSKDLAWLLMKDTGFNGGEYFLYICPKDNVFEFIKSTCNETIICVNAGDFLLGSDKKSWRVPKVILKNIDFDEVMFEFIGDSIIAESQAYSDEKMKEIDERILESFDEFVAKKCEELKAQGLLGDSDKNEKS